MVVGALAGGMMFVALTKTGAEADDMANGAAGITRGAIGISVGAAGITYPPLGTELKLLLADGTEPRPANGSSDAPPSGASYEIIISICQHHDYIKIKPIHNRPH